MLIVIMLLKYLLLWVAPFDIGGSSLNEKFDIDWIYRSEEFSAIQWHIWWTSSVSYRDVVLLTFTAHQGIVKVIATLLFIIFGVETLGRKVSLFISAMGMGILFYIIGAILKTHPPSVNPNLADSSPPPASQAMAAMLYIYVCFYSMGWGNKHYI